MIFTILQRPHLQPNMCPHYRCPEIQIFGPSITFVSSSMLFPTARQIKNGADRRRLSKMNTSRKFEIQKKRLAVRRLSQGSRQNLLSPQGDGRSKFKPRFNPEELGERRRKFPPKFATLKGSQYRWQKSDLRDKLQNRKGDDEEKSGQQDLSTFDSVRDNKPDMAFSSSALVPSAPATNVETAGGYNPFAAMLQANKTSSKTDETEKPLFHSSQQQHKTIKESKIDSSSVFKPKQDNLVFPSLQPEGLESNPFLVALKEKSIAQSINPMTIGPIVPAFPTNTVSLPVPKGELPVPALDTFSMKVGNEIFATKKILAKEQPPQDPISKSTFDSFFPGDKSLIGDLTSIKLMGVPRELNNKDFLRKFYEKFGVVKRVFCHPISNSAIITFDDHETAAKAKREGVVLTEAGDAISIFWSKSKSSKDTKSEKKVMPESRNELETIKTIAKMDDEQDLSIAHEDSMNQPADSSSRRKTALTSMINNFVNSLKTTSSRDPKEKGEFLEKIDQKIREGLEAETDVGKATLLVGTCPDMCPEKERYLREDRQRLAVYEIQTGAEYTDSKMGHYPLPNAAKVIKEYSRSSADQEKPLPHELRPGHVLQLTMNYLMLNVMDSGDKNWADWYDFVWNRTRGIRKDITQQHLCDESSVDLIEKCSRFHIICSHHLCEEDINVFDPKINNEHLTKCLQSLKHMYEDLFTQKGVVCPNEAEFRCYQILLNLNSGDILREVTEFHHEVRESQEVKFALEVLRALNSTNYVRFFKLLHTGSYLMACIMQRYFNQIRSKGLFIMNKAYTTIGGKTVPVPLSDIAILFAIDDLDEASEFCLHYGFQVDDGMVYFSKSSYEEPESNFLPARNGFIDKKRICSLGEVVNGRPLPDQIKYNPTNSFDSDGTYNGFYHNLALKGLYTAGDKNTAIDSGESVPYPMRVEKDDIKAMCVAVIVSFVSNEVRQICTNVMEEVKETVLIANEAVDAIIDKTIRAELKSCVESEVEKSSLEQLSSDVSDDVSREFLDRQIKEIVAEEFEAEKQRQESDRQVQLFHMATEFSREFLWDFLNRMSRDVIDDLIRQERKNLVMQKICQECVIVSREHLESFLSTEVRDICREAQLLEVRFRKEKLEKIKQKMLVLRTGKIFKKWIKEKLTRSHIREILHDFPCAPPTPSSDYIGHLTSHVAHASKLPYCVTLKNNTELIVSSVSSLAKRRDRHRNEVEKYHRQMLNERNELKKPVDFSAAFHLMAKSMKTKSRRNFHSKILLSYPEIKKGPFGDNSLADDIKEKFRISFDCEMEKENSTTAKVKDFGTSSASIVEGFISLTIKGMSASFSKNDVNQIEMSKELFGVTGFVFIFESQKTNWQIQKKQLEETLALKAKMQACPVLIVALNMEVSKRKVRDDLGLEKLKESGELSSYEIVSVDANTDAAQLHEELSTSFINLISETPDCPKLESSALPDLIENVLQFHFFEKIYEERIRQRERNSFFSNAHSLVDLYNAALDHIFEMCTSGRLATLPWPSKEMLQLDKKRTPDLSWNESKTFSQVKAFINSLKLPPFHINIDSDATWDECTQCCLEYLFNIVENTTLNLHSSELISRIEAVLQHYLHKWKYHSLRATLSFPWSIILEECVHVLLASIHRPQFGFEIPRLVCFYETDLYKCRLPESWIRERASAVETLRNDATSMSQGMNVSSRDDSIQSTLRDVEEAFSYLENSMSQSRMCDSDIGKSLDDLSKRQKLLEEALDEEKFAVSRISNISTNSEDDHGIPTSTKRKRSFEDWIVTEEERFMTSQSQKESCLLDFGERKRPKRKSIETRIDDLLNEVKVMRSGFDLDDSRYRHLIDP